MVVKKDKPVVLLTNDDGPPSSSSPNIYSFAQRIQETLGWEVRVVIPDCQKSWVGKAYAISDIIKGLYFYPRGPEGREGEITGQRRPLKEGETMEWVLLSGTPATCANIALHNLYPDEIDLVISGPNHGRNSSAAFALSSGTIGATLSSALSRYPSIALSYGVVTRPVSKKAIDLANSASVEIIRRLWHDWGSDATNFHEHQGGHGPGRVQLYCVNVPLVEEHLEEANRKVVWTRLARNGYGQLFKKKDKNSVTLSWDSNKPANPVVAQNSTNGAAKDTDKLQDSAAATGPGVITTSTSGEQTVPDKEGEDLCFHFAPDMQPLIFPRIEDLTVGTDSWALHYGYISVTPLQASFAEPGVESMKFGSEEHDHAKGENEIPGLWK